MIRILYCLRRARFIKGVDMLKMQEIEIGDELICIDRRGFLDADECNFDILKKFDALIVKEKEDSHIFLGDCKNYNESITSNELIFFEKVVEQVHNFDYVYELVTKAVRDGLIICRELKQNSLSFANVETPNHWHAVTHDSGQEYIDHTISMIDNLYAEYFIIKNNHCVLKVKRGAVLTFEHYEAIAVSDGIEGVPYNYVEVKFHHTDDVKWDVPHRLLVGVTVKQRMDVDS